MAHDLVRTSLVAAYIAGDLATMVYLMFFDGYTYNAWNWLIAIPVDIILGSIWPIYWAVLRPILG